MATRRRRVKHSHNKTITIIKALLRKTTYKNKKGKHHKTKKRYQSGGVPKPPAKGKEGVPTEFKYFRNLVKRGKVRADAYEKQKIYQKKDNTAEFDLHMETTGLPYHISVKSVKRKTPGQNSFSIMCGKSNRFITQAGIGNVPYHMVIVIREKHPTDQNKTQYRALELDLRGDKGKKLLFGRANDCDIKDIVKQAEYLSNAYCENEEETKPKIDAFNAYLKSLRAKIQLAPKKGNPAKNRPTRAQSSITGFNPSSPTSRDVLVSENILSSQENSQENSPDIREGKEMETAKPTSRKSFKPSVSRAPGSRGTSSRGTSSRGTSSRGTSSRGTSSRGTSSRRGISKQPTPQVSYYRSFTPRVRGTSQLSIVPEEREQSIPQVQPQLSVV
jgi:hypothetical protein